jgi:hypothetical protein
MTQLIPEGAGIGEEQVAASAPLVRALAVQRLEMIWRACEPHIHMSQEDLDLGRKPDPRFIEAGIRVVDRLTSIYGLLKPQASTDVVDKTSLEEQRQAVLSQITSLEAKIH